MTVETYRIGCDVGDLVMRRCSRYQQGIDCSHDFVGSALEVSQLVLRIESICCGEFLRAEDDAAYDRMDGIRMFFCEGSDGGITFGYPWAIVEQGSDLIE